jgi:hypothetical protein
MDDDQTMEANQKEFLLKKGFDEWETSDDEYVPPKIDNDEYWKNYENEFLANQSNNEMAQKLDYEMAQKLDYEMAQKLEDEMALKLDYEMAQKLDYEMAQKLEDEMAQKLEDEMALKLDYEMTKWNKRQLECKECGNNDLFSDKIGKFLNYCYICKKNVDV